MAFASICHKMTISSKAVLEQISGKTDGSLKIAWKHASQDPRAAARKLEAERLKIATTKLSEKVARLAKKAMPELKKGSRLTAYVFRHAISSDLKQVQNDRATMYGTKHQSNRGSQNRAARFLKIVPETLEIRNVRQREPGPARNRAPGRQ